jgi:hypothetical protein
MQPVGVAPPAHPQSRPSRTRPNPRRRVACATIPFVVGCIGLYLRFTRP